MFAIRFSSSNNTPEGRLSVAVIMVVDLFLFSASLPAEVDADLVLHPRDGRPAGPAPAAALPAAARRRGMPSFLPEIAITYTYTERRRFRSQRRDQHHSIYRI